MVSLAQGQPVLLQPEYKVKTGGDYEDTDVVEVYMDSNPEVTVAFFACYIATGKNPGEE